MFQYFRLIYQYILSIQVILNCPYHFSPEVIYFFLVVLLVYIFFSSYLKRDQNFRDFDISGKYLSYTEDVVVCVRAHMYVLQVIQHRISTFMLQTLMSRSVYLSTSHLMAYRSSSRYILRQFHHKYTQITLQIYIHTHASRK